MNTSTSKNKIKRAALLLLVLLSASAAMADILGTTLTDNCIKSFPWSEDFEGFFENQVPDCWDNSASTSFILEDHPEYLWGVYSYNENQMLRMYNYNVDPSTALINSPMIVLPSEVEIELKFDYSHTASCGPFTVKISGDGGATFVDLASYGHVGTSFSTIDPGEFTTAFIPLTEYAGQTVMIQFYAEADYFNGAIFVDNIEIDVLNNCRTPYNIAANNITTTTAELSWNILADMQSYTVRYRPTQSIRFQEGFENGIYGWTLRDCHEQTGINDVPVHSGQHAFGFHYSTTPPQYLISPMLTGLDESARLEFYYCNYNTGFPETFQIGFSSTDDATDSFVFDNEITAPDGWWHLYNEPIPAGTKYICWKCTSDNQFFLYIDDIVVSTSIPNSGWQTMTVVGNDIQVSTTLTGLTPYSRYETQVKSNCEEAEWSQVISFDTRTDFENVSDVYTIYSATGWNLFCDALQDNDTYNRFIGKIVRLVNDITVTRMAGSNYHDFMGTFDGQGHKLTIAYGTAESPLNEEYAAPFRNVENGAFIHNLNVDGHIYTSNKYASGIVGCQYGTVTVSNCRSSVIIHSSKSGDGTHGGIVAVQHNTLTVSGCVFDGRLLTTNGTTLCSGLVGYHTNGTCTISDCLYAPASDVTLGPGETYITNGATICRNYSDTPANCYYTQVLGTAQGKQAHSITGGEGITVFNGGNPTAYDVSGITGYGTGIKYDGVLYAGYEDEVRLYLGTDSGFNNNVIFHVSAGTLNGTHNPYTLIMPDQNVSITISCPTPINLATDNITATTAVLSWNILRDMESYTVRYRQTRSVVPVYNEGFENSLGDWTLQNCHVQTGISDYSVHSGQHAFRFCFNNTPPQYLISHLLTGIDHGMRLEFYYCNQSTTYPETFQIGYSSTNDAIDSFFFSNEITAEDQQWHLYSEHIPSGTKYICWKYTSNDQLSLFIDDIVVFEDMPTSAWQTLSVNGNGTEVSASLTSLTPGACYEAKVKSNCDEALWSEIINFTTNSIDIIGDTLIIYNTLGWDFFCDALQDNDTWNRFIGKTVKLAADINVTRMAGSTNHDFMGTFDGQGHTLTIAYGTAENPISTEYAAPFRYVEDGAIIHSLNVEGHIYTAKQFASGIASCQWGTVSISNCRCGVIIHSSKSGDGIHGGIVATQRGTLTVSGCVFDGRLLTTNGTTRCGGLIGWRYGTCTLSDCLYAPAEVTLASGETYIDTGATFCRNYSGTPANCYYTEVMGSAQGKQAHSITPGEGVLMEMAGEATEYDVSGITGYNTGIMYDSVLYAGYREEVNLTFTATGGFSVVATYTPEGGTATELNVVNGVYSFTMPNADVVINTVTEYIIHNAMEWENFCDALEDNDTYNRFIGKTVKLAADISVTRMAGSSTHDFMGTFDGQGHTLTIAYGSAENPISEEYAAPFRYVENGANIHSLHVDGHIYTSNQFASGIAGCQWGTVSISNCRSSVIIHSNKSGDGTHGGIVAVHHGTLTVSGCVFDGRLLTTNGTTLCGGLIGWRYGNCTLIDCLYAPTTNVTLAPGESYINNGATFCRNYSGTLDNCYYTEVLGTAQGKLAHSITIEDVTLAFAGEATEYDVSGITGYNTGIMYDSVLYAGNGEEVSLTFAPTNPEGFSVTVTYTPEGDMATELTPVNGVYSFTMPDADVVINVVVAYIIHNATEWGNFCDALQDNDTYNRFIGKTVRLAADISVTRMAGSSTHDFMGTFDGQGHTLTVAFGTAEEPFSEEYAAPFRYVENGANIHNLHVDGHIYTSNKFASGIVGCQYGTVSVSNCRSSVIVHSSKEGDGTHGGIVAVHHNTLTVNGCVFDGRLLTTNGTTLCGGLIGYHYGTITLSDCLYAPTTNITLAPGETYINNGATFCRNYNGTFDNCYYTETLGTAQGKLAIANPAVSPIGEPTATYDVSELAFYSNGVLFGEVFYYDSEMVATQTITLASGVNWVSFDVETTLDDLKAALVATGGTNIVIKAKNSSTTWNGHRWLGSLNGFNVNQMFMIILQRGCEITLQGMPMAPGAHPITISNGTNWIGYPLDESMTLTEAFAGFPANQDVVKSKTASATWNGHRWVGQLNTLQPGQGYIYQSKASGNKTFTFPSGAK